MVLDGVNVFESNTVLRIHFGQLINQIHNCFILACSRKLEVPIKYFFHNLRRVFSAEHFLAKSQLKNNATEGPEVSVQSWLALCHHFWSLIERRADKSAHFALLFVLLLFSYSSEECTCCITANRSTTVHWAPDLRITFWRVIRIGIVCVHDFGLAEVDKLDIIVCTKHDVLRLDVSVGHILLLQILKNKYNLCCIELDHFFPET